MARDIVMVNQHGHEILDHEVAERKEKAEYNRFTSILQMGDP
jgi:hypothetical protein